MLILSQLTWQIGEASKIQGRRQGKSGVVSTQAVSDYIQEKADTYGGNSARVGKQSDDGVVDSYRKCFLQSDSL